MLQNLNLEALDPTDYKTLKFYTVFQIIIYLSTGIDGAWKKIVRYLVTVDGNAPNLGIKRGEGPLSR